MVDIINDRATGDLADNPGQINGTDAEPGGVERNIVVLDIVVRQQSNEVDEDFLHALWRLAVNDGTLLRVLQVKQEFTASGGGLLWADRHLDTESRR